MEKTECLAFFSRPFSLLSGDPHGQQSCFSEMPETGVVYEYEYVGWLLEQRLDTQAFRLNDDLQIEDGPDIWLSIFALSTCRILGQLWQKS